MRASVLAMSLLSMSVMSMAEQIPMLINPMKGNKKVDIVETKNYTGSCGGAVVRMMGVTNYVPGKYPFFTVELDAGKLIVRSLSTKEFTSDEMISDHNGLACVPTKSGAKILFWSNCWGSACGDDFSFYIIDPNTAKMVAPKSLKPKDICDAACASKVLGNQVPKQINDQK